MKKIKIGAVQMTHVHANKAANMAKMESFVQEAKSQDVDLISFPEMNLTGYWQFKDSSRDEIDAMSEVVPSGESTQMVLEMSRRYQMIIGFGLIEKDESNAEYFNTYVVTMPDGRVEKHRKIHTFINSNMSSGDSYTVFEIPGGWKVGVLICYDNNIGENVRMTALQGADILLAPHQTGGCKLTRKHIMGLVDFDKWHKRDENPAAIEEELRGPKGMGWLKTWLPARAHDNGLFYVFSNGVGIDGDEIRTGNAMILDPYGRTLVETCAAKELLVVSELDPELLVESTGRRWIKTRRPELYGPLAVPTGEEVETRDSRFDVVDG